MITVIVSADHPTIVDRRCQSYGVRQVCASIKDGTRETVRAVSEKLQRRFASFAGVPYHNAIELEKWEQLWETEHRN